MQVVGKGLRCHGSRGSHEPSDSCEPGVETSDSREPSEPCLWLPRPPAANFPRMRLPLVACLLPVTLVACSRGNNEAPKPTITTVALPAPGQNEPALEPHLNVDASHPNRVFVA